MIIQKEANAVVVIPKGVKRSDEGIADRHSLRSGNLGSSVSHASE